MKSNRIPILIILLILANAAVYLVRSGTGRPPKRDPLVERGEYLVRFGGCTDCHTPKKMTPQGLVDDETRFLTGHPEGGQLPAPPDFGTSPWFAATAGMTAWAGPWGISYAANLTPDETGLKGWTEEMFVQAIKTGWHLGIENSRQIQPPMPWQYFSKMTDEKLN